MNTKRISKRSLGLTPLSLVCCVALCTHLISPASAQVNGPGPSSSALFDIVLDLPGDEAIITGVNLESIGGVLGQTTQLNVNDSGIVGTNFAARSGSEVNITGGTVGHQFDAESGSEINISGGEIDFNFFADSGSVVNISGGTFGRGFLNRVGCEVNISGGAFDSFRDFGGDVEFFGGEFRLNGAEYTGDIITLNDGDFFTGTLADGSAFILVGTSSSFSDLRNLTLTETVLPPTNFNPIVVSAPVVSGPSGLRSGQELTVAAGGSLRDNFEVVDATLNVEDGTVGGNAQTYNSELNISGGTVGLGLQALSGSEVNISGGIVGRGFDAEAGSEVNISGGTVGRFFDAEAGSVVNVSGGTIGTRFRANTGSDVELIGGQFRLNGVDFTGDTITLDGSDVFTGTLADGSAFIFGSDTLTGVALTEVALPPVNTNPIVVNTPVVSGPSGLRPGQELTVMAGGSLGDNFAAVDATFNVVAGTVGEGTEVYNSLVNISGGTVGDNFDAFSGSVVNISGGTLGDLFAVAGSVVNISGGTLGVVEADNGSEVNIRGSGFSIDGTLLNNLQPDQTFTITQRDVTLSGVLASGEPFSFDLNPFGSSSVDHFDLNATLTVTLVAPVLLGDCNQDGAVNFLDIAPFISILVAADYLVEADIDQNGVVNFLDIAPFISILIGS